MTSSRHQHLDLANRPSVRSSRWILIGSAGLVALLAMWTPSDDGVTLCPFALATGMACPGCGMTRALAWLVRGDLATSVGYHPLAPLLGVISLAATVWQVGKATKGWRSPPVALANATLIGFGILLIIVWGVRIASGTLPTV